MNDLPHEILIYVQKMKNFLEKNEESREYFLEGVDEELFFKHFGEIALKNFEEHGTPELSVEQLELLNKTVKALSVLNNQTDKFIIGKGESVWWDLGKYGLVCLN